MRLGIILIGLLGCLYLSCDLAFESKPEEHLEPAPTWQEELESKDHETN
jgi:hypothetical protein